MSPVERCFPTILIKNFQQSKLTVTSANIHIKCEKTKIIVFRTDNSYFPWGIGPAQGRGQACIMGVFTEIEICMRPILHPLSDHRRVNVFFPIMNRLNAVDVECLWITSCMRGKEIVTKQIGTVWKRASWIETCIPNRFSEAERIPNDHHGILHLAELWRLGILKTVRQSHGKFGRSDDYRNVLSIVL